MARPWLAAAPCVLLLLFLSDQAAERVLRREQALAFEYEGDRGDGQRRGLIPALRAFLVQVWLVRIDAGLRAGRPYEALRLSREVLAMAPDLPAARLRLSDILAYQVAPLESEPDRQLAWIGEALSILDEGLLRSPGSSLLHTGRGFLIWFRGSVLPEFERAFRRTHGQSTLEAGVESLVRGAELARGRWRAVRAASVGLMRRGDWYLEQARDGALGSLERAGRDYEQAAAFLRELILFSGFTRPALQIDLALAEACLQETRFEQARRAGEPVDGRSLLERVRAVRQALREGPELPSGRVRLGRILAELLAPLESDPDARRERIQEAVEILDEGLAREPDNALLLAERARFHD